MRRRLALAAVVAMSIGAAACSSSTSATKPTFKFSIATTTTLPPTVPSTAVPVPITAPTGETGEAVSVPLCKVSELRISAGTDQGAAGSSGQTIVFTNVGQSPCSMGGYPGVAALNAQGRQVAQAQRKTTGMMGGLSNVDSPLPVVTLDPGQSASAEIEGSDIEPPGVTACVIYPAFLVTPPDETRSVKVTLGPGGAFPGCVPIAVNPVVPGTTGRAQ